ncbi:MAG: exonuclease domain-containing protein [Planctomycetaceae bacterium]
MAARAARTPIAVETPLADLDFVAFDTETTGCTSATGRMVEIGAVRFRLDGTERDRFTRLINPLRPIPPMVTAIHGITDAMVRDCPGEADVLPEFLEFLGDPARTVLMAHNAPFDLAFVGSGLARCRLTPPQHAVIDTVRLSRRRAAGLPSHSLRSLVRTFGIGESTEHRGLSDSVVLKGVFLNLVSRPPAPTTAGDLFAFSPALRMRAETGTYRRRPENAWRSRSMSDRSFGGEPSARPPSARPPFASETFAPEMMASQEFAEGAVDVCGDHSSQLNAAIAAGRFVSLVYDGGRAAGDRRRVTPLRLIASASVTYLLAFCHADRKQKQYRLDRIREIVVE